MAGDVRTGSGWSLIQELHFRDWGGGWQEARDAWILIPDPEVIVDPPLIWHHFYQGAPTEVPTPSFIGAGTIIFPPQVRTEVANPGMPHYGVGFELWTVGGTPYFLDSAATPAGIYGHTFQMGGGHQGLQVRFRAQFISAGKAGPWGAWSSVHTIF